MTVFEIGSPRQYIGLDADPRPTGMPAGSTFIAGDTGKTYTFDGAAWPMTSGGSGGGGVPPEFSIGAYIEAFGGQLAYPASNDLAIPLDTDHATQFYLHGLTLNVANDGLVVATAGRYLLITAADFNQHATAWLLATSRSNQTFGNATQLIIPPASVAVFSAAHETPKGVEIMELAVGDVIQWKVDLYGLPGGESMNLQDGYLQVQYLGPIPA